MNWYVVDKKYINYLTQLKYNQVESFRSFNNEKNRLCLPAPERKSPD